MQLPKRNYTPFYHPLTSGDHEKHATPFWPARVSCDSGRSLLPFRCISLLVQRQLAREMTVPVERNFGCNSTIFNLDIERWHLQPNGLPLGLRRTSLSPTASLKEQHVLTRTMHKVSPDRSSSKYIPNQCPSLALLRRVDSFQRHTEGVLPIEQGPAFFSNTISVMFQIKANAPWLRSVKKRICLWMGSLCCTLQRMKKMAPSPRPSTT